MSTTKSDYLPNLASYNSNHHYYLHLSTRCLHSFNSACKALFKKIISLSCFCILVHFNLYFRFLISCGPIVVTSMATLTLVANWKLLGVEPGWLAGLAVEVRINEHEVENDPPVLLNMLSKTRFHSDNKLFQWLNTESVKTLNLVPICFATANNSKRHA